MTGHMAPLHQICDLAERYNAAVMVDDCQATGVIGPSGRGSAEACGVQGRVHIITSTLGKAVSGVNGAPCSLGCHVVKHTKPSCRILVGGLLN